MARKVWVVDHEIALNSGGRNNPGNLRPLQTEANAKKSDK